MERHGLIKLNQFRPYQQVVVLTSITLIKLLFFHRFIGITQKYWVISLLNGLTIFGIYYLINSIDHPKKNKFLFFAHFIVSCLLFANTMYFSHFFTLMPIHIFYQIKHLKGVSDSVRNLLNFKYMLFFVDVLLIWIYQKKIVWQSRPLQGRRRLKRYLVLSLIVLVVWGGTQTLYSNVTGYYTPLNLGVFNYHIYDIANFVMGKVPEEEVEATWTDVLEEEKSPQELPKHLGVAEGRNVIMIQAESLQSFVLNRQVNGQWITPVLNQLMKDSLYFSRYYEQVGWGNTSDAEFVSQTGYHASIKNFSFKQYEGKSLVTLPKVLKEQGYGTMVFHGNDADFWNRDDFYPFLGVDEFYSKERLEEEELIGMGIGDKSLFKQAIPHLKLVKKPFYSFFITLTSHYPYEMEGEFKYIDVGETYCETVVGNYFESVRYLDTAIGELIQSLKDEELYEDSIIIIYGDHHGLKVGNEETSEYMNTFLGKEYSEEEMLRVPLIIHVPNSDLKEEIDNVGGQVDLFPTLANLLGMDMQDYQFIGKDLLNTDDNFAVNMVHTARGSFIKDDYIFTMSKDGLFENSKAWNVFTGAEVDVHRADVRDGYDRALAEIELSEYILENELFPKIQEEDYEVDDTEVEDKTEIEPEVQEEQEEQEEDTVKPIEESQKQDSKGN